LIKNETGMTIIIEGALTQLRVKDIKDENGNEIDVDEFVKKYHHEYQLRRMLLS
jgi:hypothetical protein